MSQPPANQVRIRGLAELRETLTEHRAKTRELFRWRLYHDGYPPGWHDRRPDTELEGDG